MAGMQNNIMIKIWRSLVSEEKRARLNESLRDLKCEYENYRDMPRKHFGNKNKDKVFYVIRTDSQQRWGIFTTYLFVLNNIKYAHERNWIPVIDYKNYYLLSIQDEQDKGKENAWNYYFENLVSEYSLEEVYQSRNVVLGPLRGQPHGSVSWSDVSIQDIYSPKYDIYFGLAQNYIRFNSIMQDMIDNYYEKVFPQKGKVLGLGIRAGLWFGHITQFSAYKNHPIGSSIEECIKETEKYMLQFGCEYLYCSSDDVYYLRKIKEKFGEKCISIDRSRTHFFDECGHPLLDEQRTALDKSVSNLTRRQKSREYICEIALLARCDYLVMNLGGGAQASILLNQKKYKEVVIIGA